MTLTPAGDSQNAVSFSASLDFGDGCYPAGQDDYYVSGIAEGTFDQSTQTIGMQFNGLNVNGQTLDGACDVTFGLTATSVSLDGDWNLNYVSGGTSYSTNGEGTGTFNGSTQSTTISRFDGTIQDGTETYNAEVSNVTTSYKAYGNFIPASGTITLSGSSIRTVVMQFNSDSPTTYLVGVSIDGGEFFEWELAH